MKKRAARNIILCSGGWLEWCGDEAGGLRADVRKSKRQTAALYAFPNSPRRQREEWMSLPDAGRCPSESLQADVKSVKNAAGGVEDVARDVLCSTAAQIWTRHSGYGHCSLLR